MIFLKLPDAQVFDSVFKNPILHPGFETHSVLTGTTGENRSETLGVLARNTQRTRPHSREEPAPDARTGARAPGGR